MLTPLPGSEDHKVLHEKGVWMDPDLNKYELEHVVTEHAKMTKEVAGAYRSAWDIFYTDEHLETIMRRAARHRHQYPLVHAGADVVLERGEDRGIASLQWGLFRLKYRKDRRPGLPLESPWASTAAMPATGARAATSGAGST